MPKDTLTDDKTGVTTQQISDLHANLVAALGHGIDSVTVRKAMEDSGFRWEPHAGSPAEARALAAMHDRNLTGLDAVTSYASARVRWESAGALDHMNVLMHAFGSDGCRAAACILEANGIGSAHG